MKRKKTVLLAVSLLTFAMISSTGLTSCGGSETIDANLYKPRIVVGDSNGWGRVGDTIQLTAVVQGDNDNAVTWATLDASVATVDSSGLVTLVGVGTCNIEATSVKDPTKKTATQINVSDKLENRLVIYSQPSKVKYKINEQVSYAGLKVMGFSYVDGVQVSANGIDFANEDLTFSVAEGTTLTKAGATTITVSKSGYVSCSFTITAADTVRTKKLYIRSYPTSTYVLKEGQKTIFSTSGLRVQELVYIDGVLTERNNLSSTEYSLSIKDGYVFTEEGQFRVDITARDSDCEGTNFVVMVYTEDYSVYDIMKTLQTTKNYTAEVLNNVGTTADNTGFHYLRRYTENYYDDIEYQNINNGTEIEFSETLIKSHTGYTTYGDRGSDDRAIISYNESSGTIVGGKIVSTGPDIESWWERADALTRLFSLFNLSDIPTRTYDGKFMTINIEAVPNDNDMGDLTAAKYPLVASFLDYCGWSSNLITIMNRFTIRFNDDGNLSMLAEFGSYGTTELIVSDIGTTSSPIVESYLPSLKPDLTIDEEVRTVANALKGNNYTTVEYGNNGINKDKVRSYFTPNYYYNVASNLGYAKVTLDGVDYIQEFNKTNGIYTPVLNNAESSVKDSLIPIDKGKEFTEALNEIVTTGNYLSLSLKDVLGDDTSDGLLNTFSLYSGLSTSTTRTYQSFDLGALRTYNSYLGLTDEDLIAEGIDIAQNRLWFITTYLIDDYTQENIDTVEIWNINGVTLSGSVVAFANIGSTSVDWIESGIGNQEATLGQNA